MADVMNHLNTRVAVLGNHDFDLGLDQLIKLTNLMPNTRWLLSNVFDKRDGSILGGYDATCMIQHGGIKIGFLGLVEPEWIATLSMDTTNVECKDPAECGTRLATELREQGAEFIVALTHMRMPNDVKLGKSTTGIDLILGGHDHECFYGFVNGIHVAKSGTEFRYASVVDIAIEAGKKHVVNYKCVPVDSKIPEDPEMRALVDQYAKDMEEKMKKPIAWVDHDMDARASFVRLYESDIGNLLTDVMRNEVGSDFAILNAGTIRTDGIIRHGNFTMKDLFKLLPFQDLTCKTEITGAVLRQALENGVSQWPKHEGRFPQVSGFSFTFDPNREPGSRVVEVTVGDKPVDEQRTYTLASKPYLSLSGKDGYDCFLGSKLLTPLEECIVNSVAFSNYLRRLSVVQIWKFRLEHPQEALEQEQQKHLNKSTSLAGVASDAMPHLGKHWALASIGPPSAPKSHHFPELVNNVVSQLTVNPLRLAVMDPTIEGRIKMIPLHENNE